jgi:predicted DNA-binding transcriptional regulator AlpA
MFREVRNGAGLTDIASPTDDQYLSIEALVKYSGLSRRTLSRAMRRLRAPLPHFKVGARVLVRRSDFDTWLARTSSTGTHHTDRRYDSLVRGLARSLRK